jgi:hypothetical protein
MDGGCGLRQLLKHRVDRFRARNTDPDCVDYFVEITTHPGRHEDTILESTKAAVNYEKTRRALVSHHESLSA